MGNYEVTVLNCHLQKKNDIYYASFTPGSRWQASSPPGLLFFIIGSSSGDSFLVFPCESNSLPLLSLPSPSAPSQPPWAGSSQPRGGSPRGGAPSAPEPAAQLRQLCNDAFRPFCGNTHTHTPPLCCVPRWREKMLGLGRR